MVPIQRALQLKVTKWGALVNWAFYGGPVSENFEEVSAKAFFANGRTLDISRLTMANLDTVEQQMRDCLSGNGASSMDDAVHLYVCTHGARDCRCGTVGKDVAEALRREISARIEVDPGGLASRCTIGEVGHVGGHQCVHFFPLFSSLIRNRYAANVLIYPHGEWYDSMRFVSTFHVNNRDYQAGLFDSRAYTDHCGQRHRTGLKAFLVTQSPTHAFQLARPHGTFQGGAKRPC